MLVEALGQILGGSASDEAVRPPATTAILQAAVEVAPADQPALRALLGELGVPQKAARDLGTLVLRRELSKGLDGSIRSRCFVNGSPTSGAWACAAGHFHACCCAAMLFAGPAASVLARVACSRQLSCLMAANSSSGSSMFCPEPTDPYPHPPPPLGSAGAAADWPAAGGRQWAARSPVSQRPHHSGALLLAGSCISTMTRCAWRQNPPAACHIVHTLRVLLPIYVRLPSSPPPDLQLRLLDRQAGTSAAAERFAALLAEWQQAAAQLRELDALSVEEQRETMQCLVDEVCAVGGPQG